MRLRASAWLMGTPAMRAKRAGRSGHYDRAEPASAGGQSLGEKRRSVRQNAPLQNRFRERIGKWRSGIKLLRRTMKLRFVREDYLSDNGIFDWKKILARNLNMLRGAGDRCAKHLATRHLLLTALLLWRGLIVVTMHSWLCRVRFRLDQSADGAVIRDREPGHDGRQDYRDAKGLIGRAVHCSFFDRPKV